MSTVSDEKLRKAVREYLLNADLNTVTPKGVRKALEEKFEIKLRNRKDFIKSCAVSEMDKIEEERAKANGDEGEEDDEEDSSSDDKPIIPRKGTRKARKVPPAVNKTEVTTFEDNGVYYSRTGRPQRRSQAKKQIASQMRKSRKRKSSTNRESSDKKRRTGFNKLMIVNTESLRDFFGEAKIGRNDACKKIRQYCIENSLINQKDKREYMLDETLQDIFKVKKLTMFSLQKKLSQHLKDPDLC
ncbi:hypothetical protein AAMO2058_001515000 [Amorphochlora amoebiformis]